MMAQLSYFDFPFSRFAFCTGRGATSREVYSDSGIFRHYGRNDPKEYTLVSIQSPAEVYRDLLSMFHVGRRVKSVNFTTVLPEGLPTGKGPKEFRVGHDFDTFYKDRSGKTRQTILRSCRGVTVRRVELSPMDRLAVSRVFAGWIEWASSRHFMVFKGHYRRWLDLWFLGSAPDNVWLFLLETADEPVGIFGGETDPLTGEAQVTIAKHLPSLSSKALWTLGIRAVQERDAPTLIHCGSTADTLKSSLGFEAVPSWVPDLKTIKAPIDG